MKLYKLTPRKNTAQAMVEFAIVLPILLLLLYGLLEAGRLLFMYSTIVTASRQAARYGSATGEGINAGTPRYQDCAGIRVAANRVDFLNAFDEYDVIIQHDSGPGTTATYYCTNVPGNEPDPSLALGPSDTYTPQGNSERIIVTIEGDFNPIIPRIVPFIARTEAGGNPIRAISARTIITGVSIEVTPPPGSGGGPSTGALTLSITANPNSYTGTGQLIQYTFTITNSGTTGDLTSPFTITGAPFGVDCSGATSPLAPGASTSCTVVDYYTTQADVDTGFFEFTATASGTGPDGNPATDDFTSKIVYSAPVENPALSLTKTASADLVTAGDQITYTFTVTNSGNVDLTGASVSDPRFGGTMAGCSGDLAVGASLTCTSSAYTVTSADVQAGQIVNTATASAMYGATTVDTTASETVDIYEGTLFLTVSPSPSSLSAPGTITYNYRIKNNTASTLYVSQDPDFSPLSGHPGTHNCAPGTQLNAGDPNGYTCTGTYTVTDFNSAVACTVNGITGYCLQHTITANACTETGTSGCNGNRDRTSNSVTVRIPVTVSASLAFVSVTVSPASPAQLSPPANTFPVNHPIVYTYTVKNQGNVTLSLSSPPITDAMVLPADLSCDRTSLTPPGPDLNNPVATSIATCTGTHRVTQPDLDAGLIASRQVTASAAFGTQVVSAVGQAPAVTTFQGPRLSLQITPNPTTFPTTGQVILYTYTLTNTGTIPLNGPYSVTTVSGPTVGVDCSSAVSPLVSGASTTCIGSANVSGPPGSSVVHQANARASDGTQQITSNTASATVTNPVLACSSITGSALSITGSTMSMTITNNNGYAVTVSSIEVTWNNDLGRKQGNKDEPLDLLNARWGTTTPFWTASGTVNAPTYMISTFSPSSARTIAANSSPVIVLTFSDTYVNIDKTEKIKINLSTPGCENYSIQSPPMP